MQCFSLAPRLWSDLGRNNDRQIVALNHADDHKVRDPIKVFIYFNKTEMKIVGSPAFQRLRNTRQLAFIHLVYSGA